MTEHETFPGKTYIVTSKAGCTITDASGELEETCEPGKQKVISAPSDKLYTSEHAVVRETFNGAPAVQSGGGEGGECLVTKDANNNYLLGEGAQVSEGVRFGMGLGQSSKVQGNQTVAVGYSSAAVAYGVAVGAQAYAAYSGDVAIGYQASGTLSIGEGARGGGISIGASSYSSSAKSVTIGISATCSNDGEIALGYKAAATMEHASALGLEAKAGYGYSMAIGEKTSTYEISSLILAARSPEPGCVLTFELLAKNMAATGEDGAIGDANAFITGGALRFGVHDLVSGERETMTISVESLWAMLRAAGGVSEKAAVNEYYN